MDVNCYHELDDASPESFELLADLIDASRTDEQMVYREAELDELWRWLEIARRAAPAAEAGSIATRVAAVHEVHDMIEDVTTARIAADRLRAVARANTSYE